MPLLKGFENLKMQLDSIKSATNTFSKENQIGGGGFGPVFKGELSWKEKTMITVAVKRLNREFGQGDPEFFKEIIMLSAYKHENIISLLGYCDEEEEKILVYEYASKQSLDRHLRSKELTWVTRLQICIGSARGLAYLHDPAGGHQRLLHRDIKSANILLDENWNAKIADFGLSKMGPANQQISFYITHNISVVGTLGYTDPQYMESGILTKESDVYSFGVVLFEVLCGRLCITDPNDRSKSLTNMVRRYHRRDRLNEMVWSHTKDEIHPSSLKCFSTIAYQCLNGEYDTRPIMKKIVRELETSLEYQSVADSKSSLVKEFEHLRIGLDIIKLATNNFGEDHFIAEGGSAGKLYRGEFKHSKGQVVCTVKRLDCTKDDMDLLFWREIMLLSSYKHKNVLSLKGFCDESEERIIVYDFAIHQRLDFLLLDPKFTWIQRLKACLEAACGLEYLHDDKVTQKSVVHGHIRSANILLDKNWNAYITNFGLSRYGHANEEHKLLFSDDKNATLGYFDPIYKNTVQLTKETDVYSFGVVLFEALCSRPCVDNSYKDERRSLPVLIRKNYQEQKIDSVVDDNLRRQIDQNCFDTFVELAYKCLESDKSRHPSANLVMKTLKTALEYQEVFEAKTNRLLDFEEICPPGGSDLVILYTTSVKGIRKTSKDCSRVHSLLKSLKVLYQERDIAMYSDFRDELQNLGKLSALPRLFIKGRYIGGADDIFLLHEQGKFQPLVRDILNKSEGPCKRCAGVRSVVCRKCNGSNILKSVEGGRTRCTECNKNGLIKCPICF
ncbi:uncharacterized protein LOC111897576 [Lactuca sativa]|uniref:Protein kinase domain-containing protein n=1 Tax=Lactuca sativa TaxID=4236 RepID=A0A9R1X9V8_LACSA|nr:uncharacterized protein LOC111897576 [Lactuca sativa]KAJ0206305.1 hypothetical protein LSAT_V11C500243950 [Lactuca sativa]